MDGWGGAILIWDGASVVVSDSAFERNTSRHAGGAIYVFGATSTLQSLRTQWKQNETLLGKGGAVYNQGTFDSVAEDLFSFNGAVQGGAIYNDSQLTVSIATLERNDADSTGGALHNKGTSTLFGVTLSGNQTNDSAGKGGGIYNEALVVLYNATLSGNASSYGGAMVNAQPSALVHLTHATVTANQASLIGGGISCFSGKAQLVNSIVADNSPGGNCSAPTGSTGVVESQGFNLSSDDGCDFDQPGDIENTDPVLGPLANNGGFTKTHMPRPESDAIDGANLIQCAPEDGATLAIGAPLDFRSISAIRSPTPGR